MISSLSAVLSLRYWVTYLDLVKVKIVAQNQADLRSFLHALNREFDVPAKKFTH
jgi:hypothetical protein